ncbi:exonuclease V subunit beta [Klebsiella michiganensis]|nr:exonuclease V subunit beta [Klebsiella michiganensis]
MITNATSAALFISFYAAWTGQDGGQGIFSTRPALPLINGLDALFAGETQEVVL